MVTTPVPFSVETLTQEEAQALYHEWSKKIHYHDDLYYNQNRNEISDFEYDQLRQNLKKLTVHFPGLEIDHTLESRVGSPVTLTPFQKIKHEFAMLSLDNAFSFEDIIAFFSKAYRYANITHESFERCVAEPKIDGLSATLCYEKGQLILGATRGDGIEGENITENLKQVEGIVHTLARSSHQKSYPKRFHVRGEVYMTLEDFHRLNEQRRKNDEPLFSNPRNAAAGSLRQLDPVITKERRLHFFAYALLHDGDALFCPTQTEVLKTLRDMGFSTNPLSTPCADQESLASYIRDLEQKRDHLPYQIDGIVIKLDDLHLSHRLGHIGRTPRYATAYKFKAEQATTKIIEIITQVGRTGVVTPVAVLEPVHVGGVIVSRATLHNNQEILLKDIRVHDTVIIQRAGDVIPQVVSVVYDQRPPQAVPYIFPTQCPSCSSPLHYDDQNVAIKCLNGLSCDAQIIERFCHFISRDALNIEGLGEKNIQKFFEKKWIRRFPDLFDPVLLDHLKGMEGFKDLSIQNLKTSIQASKILSLERFIYALGIPKVGLITARQMSKIFKTGQQFYDGLVDLLQDPQDMTYQNLLGVDGIGPLILKEICDFAGNAQNIDTVRTLMTILTLQEDHEQQNTSHVLNGKNVIFTGTLSTLGRSEVKTMAQKHGAHVMSAISQKVDYVIVGEDAGSKLTKAKALGLKILTEEEWLALVNGQE